MNYRHVFHAGNFADVIKHVALVAVLQHLRRKETPFCVIDTHAGGGLYDIEGPEAARSCEAAEGIARIRDLTGRTDLPDCLRVYLDFVNSEGKNCYPGSPRLAARLLRPQDRLLAIEKHRDAAGVLARALAAFPRARAIEGDGYARLPALLPPGERRGVVLIDPPYEAEDEFVRAANLLALAHRRFATGIYLLWFPIKSAAAAAALVGEVRAHGIARAIRLDIDIGREQKAGRERLTSAGLIIANPPHSLEEKIKAAAEWLAPRLGRNAGVPAAITIAPI
jgi:23S rRNA (adenine2030-N6)-methyltransferase